MSLRLIKGESKKLINLVGEKGLELFSASQTFYFVKCEGGKQGKLKQPLAVFAYRFKSSVMKLKTPKKGSV